MQLTYYKLAKILGILNRLVLSMTFLNDVGHSRKCASLVCFSGLGDANVRQQAVSKIQVPHIYAGPMYMNGIFLK